VYTKGSPYAWYWTTNFGGVMDTTTSVALSNHISISSGSYQYNTVREVKVSGQVVGNFSGKSASVRVEKQVYDKTKGSYVWKAYNTYSRTLNSDSRYYVSLSPGVGKYRVRASFAGGGDVKPSSSPFQYFQVKEGQTSGVAYAPGPVGDQVQSVAPGRDPSPANQPAGSLAHPDRIIVRFKDSTSPTTRASVRRQEKLERIRGIGLVRAEVVRVAGRSPEAAVRALNRRPDVEYAELDQVLTPSGYSEEEYFTLLWGIQNTGQNSGSVDVDTNALEASAVTLGDPNLVVAVIDDGVDFNHPDLAGRQWVNPGESGNGRETNGTDDDGNGYIDDVNGWDFYHGDRTVHDAGEEEHGTHVSGTVAASLNGKGVVGLAPNIKIMALKFLGPNGGYTSDAILAIEYARNKGVRISNNSWGGGGYSKALKSAIEASGSLFVAAAGNSAADIDASPSYPAAYDSPNILSVAAIDNQGKLASFSNYGATNVDISAPGVNILSSIPGGGYESWNGTSMAAPHATGAAALVASLYPSMLGDPVGLKTTLIDTGKSASLTTGKTASGRMIDARAALGGEEPLDTEPPTGTVAVNGGATYSRSSTVRLTMSATDSGSGVSEVRISNSGTASNGLLSLGKTFAYTTPISWNLADSTTGGSSANGTRTVYVQWADKAGNWSRIQSDRIVLDTVAPVATSPVQRFLIPSQLGTTVIPVRLNWSSTDATSGIARYELQQSTNGGTYANVTLPSGAATSLTPSLNPGYTYQFRARAQDKAGSWSAWAHGPRFKVVAYQESSTVLKLAGTWKTAKLTASYGGALRYATAGGSGVSLTFKSRNIALVARRSAGSGRAAIYL
ncbi:MAG: S8 family serine peptidase, partial [Chloroflexota bacterium]|nr:S8 family serine peptidase [Chloroflexota bacterium]